MNEPKTIEELKQQLFDLTSSAQMCVGAAGIGDVSELCGWIDKTKRQLAEAQAERNAALVTVGLQDDAIVSLQQQRDEAQAACAEMRGFIDEVSLACQHPTATADERMSRIRAYAQKHLPAWPNRPDCGQSLLDERDRLRKALVVIEDVATTADLTVLRDIANKALYP